MQTKDLVLDDSGQRQVVEELRELFPNVRVAVLAKTFVVETVPISSNLHVSSYTI